MGQVEFYVVQFDSGVGLHAEALAKAGATPRLSDVASAKSDGCPFDLNSMRSNSIRGRGRRLLA